MEAVRNVVGPGPCSLHEPRFAGNEREYLNDCIDSTFVSSIGPYVERFESDLAKYTGAKYAVATVNGTAALHISLLVAGVKPGDEVLVPTLSFVATANAVRYCGALPHFVDSEPETLGVDPRALRDWLEYCTVKDAGVTINRFSRNPIRALVPMHTFGHPCDMDALLEVAADFNLVVVEDAAESLGSWYKGKHTGTLGLLGIVSFNGNKTITTGGGGAILTEDAELARRAKHLTTTAKSSQKWEFIHDEVGFNYRMPNLNAALGCAQLEQLPEFLGSKRGLHQRYLDEFDGISGVRIFKEPKDCTSNYWLQTLLLDAPDAVQRDEILETANRAGFMMRPAWALLHRSAPYVASPSAPVPVAEQLEMQILNLPSSAGIK